MSKYNDPFEIAFFDYLDGNSGNLIVNPDKGDLEEVPVSYFFRNFNQMPEMEKIAIENCTGSVLDIGAGSGCHSLVLQGKLMDVTALEIKEGLIEVMKKQGVRKTILADIMTYNAGTFDTLLMLMNGAGIMGTLDKLGSFLKHARTLLNYGGQIILDSSDLLYLYEEDDGSYRINMNESYYGEIIYQVSYKNVAGEPFRWLFVDFSTLEQIAAEAGFVTDLLFEGDHFDYLVRLT